MSALTLVVHRGFAEVSAAITGIGVEQTRRVPTAAQPFRQAPASASPQVTLTPEQIAQDQVLRLAEQVQSRFAAQERQYVKACWSQQSPGGFGDRATYEVRFSFDAQGNEQKREILPDARGGQKLLDCVRGQSMPRLNMPPTGSALQTSVQLHVP